jgi:SAM-dependent methyltransferase
MIESIFNLVWKVINRIPNLKERLHRFYAWKIFEYAPLLKRVIYYFYDRFWFLELALSDQPVDFSQKLLSNYEIDLSRLQYIALTDIKKHEDWDKVPKIEKIDSTDVYNVLYQHFLQNKNWQEINGNKEILNASLRYPLQSNPLNDAELARFLQDLDKLYSNSNLNLFSDEFKKIKVAIARNGDYILLDGLFHVMLLKILKIQKVPVHVVIRHPEWIKFCKEFFQFQSVHGEIYQPITHPDLKFKTTYSDKRFDIMKDNLSLQKGRLLDIGANLGYFCHKFEEVGFECYAVEIRPSNVYFMRKLRDLERKKFKIINSSIFDLKGKLDFDVVIAFNIFHHFLREKKLYNQLIDFLEKLHLKVMFFQPHNPMEKVMQNAYQNYSNQEFVDFILEHSCLTNFAMLAESPEGKGRPIYKLYR